MCREAGLVPAGPQRGIPTPHRANHPQGGDRHHREGGGRWIRSPPGSESIHLAGIWIQHPARTEVSPCSKFIQIHPNSSKFFQEAPGFTSRAAAPSESSPKPLSAGAGAARGAHGGPACRALHLEAIPKDHCLLASRHRWGMRPPPQSPQLLRSPEPCRACSSPTAAPGRQSREQARGTPVRLPTVGHPSPGISSPS